MQKTHVDKHGGNDARPLPAHQNVSGVIRPKLHKLIDRRTHWAYAAKDHPQKHGAIDPYQ